MTLILKSYVKGRAAINPASSVAVSLPFLGKITGKLESVHLDGSGYVDIRLPDGRLLCCALTNLVAL